MPAPLSLLMAAQSHTFGNEKRDQTAYPLNEQAYPLRPGTPDFDFWGTQTGIKDPEKLKKHILELQSEAYSVSRTHQYEMSHKLRLRLPQLFAYGCIRYFRFLG